MKERNPSDLKGVRTHAMSFHDSCKCATSQRIDKEKANQSKSTPCNLIIPVKEPFLTSKECEPIHAMQFHDSCKNICSPHPLEGKKQTRVNPFPMSRRQNEMKTLKRGISMSNSHSIRYLPPASNLIPANQSIKTSE